MRLENPSIVALASVLFACHSGSDAGSGAVAEFTLPPVSMRENLALAADGMYGAGDLRMVGASEESGGRDLDGDGDEIDVVMQILDLRAKQLIDTGMAVPRNLPLFRGPVASCSEALGVFKISEAETGRDIDQDGIPGEVSTWIFNRRSGTLRNLSFEHVQVVFGSDLAAFRADDGDMLVFDARDGSLTRQPVEPILQGAHDRVVAFTRSEGGAFDLNADGDATDEAILQLYDADSRRIRNTSFAVAGFDLRLAGGFVGFNVSEAEQGGLDLNGDGDARDLVFVVVDEKSGRPRFPGFVGASFADPSDKEPHGFLLALSEQDGDRNGDRDTRDLVAALYDPRSDRLFDTGLAIEPGLQSVRRSGRWINVIVSERSQGQDLDGDGRLESRVAHVFDTLTGQSINLRFHGLSRAAFENLIVMLVFGRGSPPASDLVAWDARAGVLRRLGPDVSSVCGASGGTALVSVQEGAQDLNGDGDVLDFVFALLDVDTGRVRGLGLATTVIQASVSPSGQALLLVDEADQGVDLNGDGDLLDQVVHRIGINDPRG